MKNFFKLFGIIAVVAVIGFSMAACGGDEETDSFYVKITKSSYSFGGTSDVSKEVRVGDTLSVRAGFSVGDKQLIEPKYQWYRDGTAIQGAIRYDYTVVSDDVGHKLKVQASGKAGYGGENVTATSAETITVTAN